MLSEVLTQASVIAQSVLPKGDDKYEEAKRWIIEDYVGVHF